MGQAEAVRVLQPGDTNDNRILSSSLLLASSAGEVDKVRGLLQAAAIYDDLDRSIHIVATKVDFIRSLMEATSKGHLEVVRLLLLFQVDPDSTHDGTTALTLAVEAGHLEVVRLLLVARANANLEPIRTAVSPLFCAAYHGHVDIMRCLVEVGHADLRLLTDKFGVTALLFAASRGDIDVVRYLVDECRCDVNQATPDSGETPLYVAVTYNCPNVVRFLLDRRANVDQVTLEGVTPLLLAAYRGHRDVVRALLARPDIDVNFSGDTGMTPLLVATKYGRLEVVRLLLARPDIDVNFPDDTGMTPLMVAAKNGSLEMVRILLATGAIDTRETPLFA
jgi:ankyrin repeat protein